jgi:lysine 2,3-aminomutase
MSGDSVFVLSDKRERTASRIPPLGEVGLGELFEALHRLAASVNVKEPWRSPDAERLDRMTAEEWLHGEVRHPDGRRFFHPFLGQLMATDPAVVSALHMGYYIRAGGGLRYLNAFEGGAQEWRVSGGAHRIAEALAATLGDRVLQGQAVLRISESSSGVQIATRDCSWTARAVIVAVPPLVAQHIEFQSATASLPNVARAVAGCVVKIQLVYPEPRWRDLGLSGWSVSARGPLVSTVDDSPETGGLGVLTGFITGTNARAFSAMTREEKERCLREQMHVLFPELRPPSAWHETDWTREAFSRGCYATVFAPGHWTAVGAAPEPVASRILWAGTETASEFFGSMEGALRSGRAAAERVRRLVTDERPARAKARPASAPHAHRELIGDAWWQNIPAYASTDETAFLDHTWQAKNSITRVSKLVELIRDIVPSGFVDDLEEGMKRAPMSMRVSPYVVSLIDWAHPYDDPLRIQFVPLASRLQPDHPKLALDSLHEQADSPVPGLTHRYRDKVLFLPLDTCPVYCRFCTRSYAVGLDTEHVEKVHLRPNDERWRRAYDYIDSHPEVEDVVVSGGDAYQLRADQLHDIGRALLAIPHVRRIRFGTKGIAVMPMKILTDTAWTDALTRIVDMGRRIRKEVAVHTHFNSANEVTGITDRAMALLFEHGIVVRNQSVLIRGVNDTGEKMALLIKRLCHVNVRPYYVYAHDMVCGVEDMRTSLSTLLTVEKEIRGLTAGFNTPTFVVDAPGGGGKRDAHSYEYYDRDTGISVYAAPRVKPGQLFLYFDPLACLPPAEQCRWFDAASQSEMIREALTRARAAEPRASYTPSFPTWS